MMHTAWKRNGGDPTSLDVRGIAAIVFLAAVLGPCLSGLRGGDDASGPLLTAPTEASAAKDLATEIRVRTALEADQSLAPRKLNLRVKVTTGIAQLSGPVPSAERPPPSR